VRVQSWKGLILDFWLPRPCCCGATSPLVPNWGRLSLWAVRANLRVASLPGGAKQDVIPAIGSRVRGNHREQPMQIDESSAGVRLFWLWEGYVRSRNGNRAISLPLLLHPSFPCPSLVLFCSVSLLLCTLFSLLYTRSI